MATTRAFRADRLPGDLYQQFMDAGFRRSGKVIYQPICQNCTACVQLRVPVEGFAPDKSQRRCARRNADLLVSQGKPDLTDEKLDLYRRYLTDWHHRSGADELHRESLERFLYESPLETIEFCYRTPDQKLVAVGIADTSPCFFSSVYFYFDPAESARSLGTFGVLQEIQFAKMQRIKYYYLGFWVDGCADMQYKSRFRPYQILDENGNWIEK